jgi:hypothetical protein
MSKSRLSAIFILVFLATSITFAQSFFSSAPAAGAGASTNSLTPPKALSPQDFQSLVKQQNQQSVNQSMGSQPAFNAPPTPKPTTSPDLNTPTTDSNVASDTTTTPPAADTTSAASTTDATNADQSESYSGYNSTNTNNSSNGSKNNSTNSSQQKNGLGIQY